MKGESEMEKFTIDSLPEYFQFTLGSDETIFHATYPRNDYGFRNNNRVFVGWIKDNEPRATSYLIRQHVELVECGSWKMISVK